MKSKPELRFRHFLEQKMLGKWLMTWHEDRVISPGVPDLHYCFYTDADGQYRTGWLELKANDHPLNIKNKIHVEPSQHQYIRRWWQVVPIHFLIRIVNRVYLIEGCYHDEIPFCMNETDFLTMNCKHFTQDEITLILPDLLKDITRY